MRDFRANGDINVHGDVVITDNSQQTYKPLTQCSNEELRAERSHRFQLLEEEKNRKSRFALSFILIAVIAGIVLAAWYFISGKVELAMFGVGIAGVVMPVAASFKIAEQQTQFEARQIQALNEIQMLLRERREE